MSRSGFKSTVSNYQRYMRLRRRRVARYYFRLAKATLLIAIIPIVVLTILVIYGKLAFSEGMMAMAASFVGSMFFARPYLADILALTTYVEQLSLDRHAKAPELSLISNVGPLSRAVKKLHDSWGERKIELESALAESKILFDTLPDMMVMLNEHQEVIRANNAAFVRIGKNIIGRKLADVVNAPMLFEHITEVLTTDVSSDIDIEITTQKTTKDYRARIERFPVKSKGGIALVIVMIDITESKKARQLIKDFVANASHEIRTPLTSLVGFIETVKEMEADDEEDRKHFLGIMEEQASHMSKLVQELLSLSKIEMNEHTHPTDQASISDIINSAIRRIGWLAEENNNKIEISGVKDLPDIIADSDELAQVVINLISNAVKYGKEGVPIKVVAGITSNIPTTAEYVKHEAKVVFISIIDKGEGISAEDLPRITERFYRVDKVRSRKAGGTGLGLAIVKHILKRHRADLAIESELGKGSTFSIYIPIPN